MSGGHFDYSQYKISQIQEELKSVVVNNEDERTNEYGDKQGYFFRPDTLERFTQGQVLAGLTYIFAQRADWLLSGDDGEDSFHQRLEADLTAYFAGLTKAEVQAMMTICAQLSQRAQALDKSA